MPTPVTHVLLMLEDISGSSPGSTPMYGAVIEVNGPQATVGLLQAPPSHTSVQVRASLLSTRRVDPAEFTNGAPGAWLRKPVVGISNGTYAYGQVVSYGEGMASIRTSSNLVESTIADLVEVAPVLCFLMVNFQPSTDTLDVATLLQHHELILDRLLARNGQRATRVIPRILHGIVPARQQPEATTASRWINSTSGKESLVSVRHAVDYVYYIDGGSRIPSSQQNNIGTRLDNDPTQAPLPMTRDDVDDSAENDDLDAILQAIQSSNSSRPAAPGPRSIAIDDSVPNAQQETINQEVEPASHSKF
ncbi:hypothetical protein L917_20630 [Phytophthora nicotianae]|uniref:Uncharacterized protein n=1 Tax=Phytophthora nicotianae TaxID=4792 RepID=W2K1Z2_PHYNI|nr:hypothetical protein L917_20630 [Phytophthora nicotianae]